MKNCGLKMSKIDLIFLKSFLWIFEAITKVCESFLAPKFPERLFLINRFLKSVLVKFETMLRLKV